MSEFHKTLLLLAQESETIQKKEADLQTEIGLFQQKLVGFLKENGLPERHTVPELMLLAVRKCAA